MLQTCCVKIFQFSDLWPSSFYHRPSLIIHVDPLLWTLRVKNTETLESDLKSGPRTCARHVTVFRHSVSNFGEMTDKVFVSKLNFLLSRLKLMYWNDGIETYHEYDILTAVNREVSQIIIHEGISKMTHHVVTIFCNIKAFIWGITFGSSFDNLARRLKKVEIFREKRKVQVNYKRFAECPVSFGLLIFSRFQWKLFTINRPFISIPDGLFSNWPNFS